MFCLLVLMQYLIFPITYYLYRFDFKGQSLFFVIQLIILSKKGLVNPKSPTSTLPSFTVVKLGNILLFINGRSVLDSLFPLIFIEMALYGQKTMQTPQNTHFKGLLKTGRRSNFVVFTPFTKIGRASAFFGHTFTHCMHVVQVFVATRSSVVLVIYSTFNVRLSSFKVSSIAGQFMLSPLQCSLNWIFCGFILAQWIWSNFPELLCIFINEVGELSTLARGDVC